jgi:hypothetical protein
MSTKYLYQVDAVVHTDDKLVPVLRETLFVVARKPSQVASKVMKTLGDRLIFIHEMTVVAVHDPVISQSTSTSLFIA